MGVLEDIAAGNTTSPTSAGQATSGKYVVQDGNALVRNQDGTATPISESRWAQRQLDGTYVVDSNFQMANIDGSTVPVSQYRYAAPLTTQGTPPASSPTAPTQPGGAQTNANAQAHLADVLNQFGLGSLGDWAYGLLTQGYNDDYVLQELRKRPEFAQRFPAIAERQAKGLPPISPAEYVATEKSYDQVMHDTGLSGFFDRNDLYTKWIAGDTSPAEAKQRADDAYQAVMGEPIEARAELTRLFGVGAGAAGVAYFLDPTNALPKLQQQLQAGGIAGQAIRSSYSLLTSDEAMRLAQQGVTDQAARTGFTDLAKRQELFNPLPGEAGYQGLSQDQQLAAQFGGNAQDQLALEREAQNRAAAFAGSAGFRETQAGLSGVGATST